MKTINKATAAVLLMTGAFAVIANIQGCSKSGTGSVNTSANETVKVSMANVVKAVTKSTVQAAAEETETGAQAVQIAAVLPETGAAKAETVYVFTKPVTDHSDKNTAKKAVFNKTDRTNDDTAVHTVTVDFGGMKAPEKTTETKTPKVDQGGIKAPSTKNTVTSTAVPSYNPADYQIAGRPLTATKTATMVSMSVSADQVSMTVSAGNTNDDDKTATPDIKPNHKHHGDKPAPDCKKGGHHGKHHGDKPAPDCKKGGKHSHGPHDFGKDHGPHGDKHGPHAQHVSRHCDAGRHAGNFGKAPRK